MEAQDHLHISLDKEEAMALILEEEIQDMELHQELEEETTLDLLQVLAMEQAAEQVNMEEPLDQLQEPEQDNLVNMEPLELELDQDLEQDNIVLPLEDLDLAEQDKQVQVLLDTDNPQVNMDNHQANMGNHQDNMEPPEQEVANILVVHQDKEELELEVLLEELLEEAQLEEDHTALHHTDTVETDNDL